MRHPHSLPHGLTSSGRLARGKPARPAHFSRPRRGPSAIAGPHLGRGGCAPVPDSLRHPAHIFAHGECDCLTCTSFHALCGRALRASRKMNISETRLRLARSGPVCVDHFTPRHGSADEWLSGWLTVARRAQGLSRLFAARRAGLTVAGVRPPFVRLLAPTDAHGRGSPCP